MRLTRVPLVQVEDHLINLKFLLNAYVEEDGSYPPKFGIRYFTDAATLPEDPDGNVGLFIKIGTKKKALETLASLVQTADTLMIEEDE